MIIRKANFNDISSIAKVHVDTWKTTYKGIVPNDYLESLSYKKQKKSGKKCF